MNPRLIAHLLPILAVLLLSLPAAAQDAEEEGAAILDLNAEYASAARRAERGDYSGAIRIFKEIAAQDPYWSDAVYNIGSLAEHRSAWQDCALYSLRYLILEPNDPETHSIQRRHERCSEAIGRAGDLHVPTTTPEGIPVSLDGLVLGDGSLGPLRLAAGTYTISTQHHDHFPFSQEVEVVEGETTTFPVVMEIMPTYGSISLDVSQPGARITLDGVEQGTSPLAESIRLETGTYRVEVLLDGYHPWRRNVEVLCDLDDTSEVRLIDESVDLSRF